MVSTLNPITREKEFFGGIGAVTLSVGLPIITILLYLLVNESYLIDGVSIDFERVKDLFYQECVVDFWENVFDKNVWCAYLLWFGIFLVADIILPGQQVKGVKLRDGSQLEYKINGKSVSLVFISLLTSRYYITEGKMPELQFLYANFNKFLYVTIVFSYLLSTFLYIYSFVPLLKKNHLGTNERILALAGNSYNPIYNWFIGRELNPRILNVWDLKLYCETRPGLLLWFLINLSCLHHVYLTTGELSDSLVLVNLLQGFYVFDGVLNEEGLLTMMDIATDGFGFMLVFGDLCWVPFTYSLQCRYLSFNVINLGKFYSLIILAIQCIGFYIFRAANKQKSDFRMGKLQHMKSLKTKRGTNLLCDGWWGLSQHMNYFGDWIISWAWCLPTGFNTPVTYFYVIYFGSLLVHRQTRDEKSCREKYGKDWDTYCEKVPYKIIPYVY